MATLDPIPDLSPAPLLLRSSLPGRACAVALAVLAFGLVLTLVASGRMREAEEQAKIHEAELLTHQIALGLAGQMRDYDRLARDLAALFEDGQEVSQAEWAERMAVPEGGGERLGLRGIGYVQRVTPGALPEVGASLVEQWGEGARLRPAGAGPLYHIVTLLAPAAAFPGLAGQDVTPQPARIQAIEEAIDENRAVLTALAPGEDPAATAWVAFPVYRGGGAAATAAWRPEATRGVAFVAFDPHTALAVMARRIGVHGKVGLADVTEGGAGPGAGLAEAGPPPMAEEVVEVSGRRWKVMVDGVAVGPATHSASMVTLAAGVLVSALLALLALHLLTRDALARRQALGMTRDLREREVQLRRTEDFLSRLIEVLPTPVMVKDEQFRYLIVNRAAARLFGLPAEALLGRCVGDFLPPEFAERQSREDREVLAGGAISMREDLLVRPGAEPMPMVVRKTRLDGAAGRPVLVTVVTDLSEERRARAELEEAHATTHSLLTAIPDVLVQMDQDLRFVSYHASDPRDLTYPPERFVGRSVDEVMSPARAAAYRQAAARAKAGEGPQIMEYASWDGAGRPQDYEARMVALATGGFLTVIRRITERKRAEDALRESEARWQFALEGAGDGLWDWQIKAGRIYRSRRWFALRGEDQEGGWQSEGDWLEAIHPDDRAPTQALVRDLLTGRIEHYSNEYRVRHRDGNWRWFLARGKVMERDGEGQALRVVGTTADMSERKRVEWALRESEERFRRIADTAPVLLWMSFPEGALNYVNKTWLDFVGGSLETAMDDAAGAWVHPEDRPRVAWRARGENPRAAFRDEFRLRRADGEYRWILVHGEPRDDGLGNLAGYIGTCTDITDQKRAEQDLRNHRDRLRDMVAEQTRDLIAAKEAAESANEAKSQFLTNMSHELRTPLHAVLSYAKMGETKFDRIPAERVKGYFERIHTSGKGLLALLNDLLDLAKLEAGKMVLDFRRLDVETLTREVAGEFEALYLSRQIVLEIEAEPGLPACLADVQRIGQVLRNLLSNAVKFGPPASVVQVRLSTGALPMGEGGRVLPAVRLEVADQGAGIPDGELEAVFDKFVQSSKTRSGAGGTGLGLSICREIMEAHRGRIRASNRPGGGALFEALLPALAEDNYKFMQSKSGSPSADRWIRETHS